MFEDPKDSKKIYMRIPGFEPEQMAWEAIIIPLDHIRIIFFKHNTFF